MNTPLLKLLRGLCAVVALLAGAVALGTPSRAYLINNTSGNNLKWYPTDMPVAWEVNPIPVTGVTAAAWQRTLKTAMRTWIDVPTADINFCVIGTTNIAVETNDSHSVLYAKNTGWLGENPTGAGVLALTNYNFQTTGQLIDTDMDFNGTDFTWSTAFTAERANVPGTDTDYDLQSIMTHELGHSIGFGHSIAGPGVATLPPDYDDNGTPTTADDQVNGPTQNTMDPATLKGETFQRSLQQDDIDAINANYTAATTALLRPSAFLIEPDGVSDSPTGGSYTIQWEGEYEGPSTPTVSFYYTQDITRASVASLTGATLIASGITSPKNGTVASYLWTFASVPAGNYYIIAVVTADSFTRRDVSPGVVTVATPVLTLTAPTAAAITMTPYSSYNVTWTSSGSDLGPIKIDLSLDNGATYSKVVNGGTANTGLCAFTVPDPVKAFGAGPQTTCKIRISYLNMATVTDQSANPFTIALAQDSLTVTAPNGGEFLTAGATTFIQFNASGPLVGDDFHIQYTPDAGTTWYDVEKNIHIATANPRTYTWLVPGAFSSFNLVRVRSVTTPYFVDTSDSPFTIDPTTPSALTVVPASLSFEVMVGGANPPNQTLVVTNAQASTVLNGLNTSTSSLSNLTLPGIPSTIPANTAATVNVALDVTGLTAGTTNATITLKGTGVTNVTVPVTITVRALGTATPLTYNPASLSFTGTAGSLSPGSKTVSVGNPAGNVITSVDLTTTDAALLASPGRFSLNAGANQTVTVVTDTSALASGTVKHSTLTTTAANIGTGSYPVTVTMVGAAAQGPRQKNKASPCAIGGSETGGGAGLFGVLTGLLAVAFLRRRLTRA